MNMWRLLVGISWVAFAGAAVAQNNSSTFSQTGSDNLAAVDNDSPGNTDNAAAITQNGTFNRADVLQIGSSNSSLIEQLGSFQTSTHQQVGTFNGARSRQIGDFQIMASTQVGDFNSSTLEQAGIHNRSFVRQGYAFDSTVPQGEQRPGDFNSASIDQNGAGLDSVIDQRAESANGVRASNNRATVLQRSNGSSTSIQQTSSILQESSGNIAEVSQYDGAIGAANSSSIEQRNSATPASVSVNSASVEQRGSGQSSQVSQDGNSNVAAVQMSGGGSAADEGNVSVISQQGTGHSATLTHVDRAGTTRRGNVSDISQTGSSQSSIVYQAGLGDQSQIIQRDGVNSGTYASGERARASALVAQNAIGATARIEQQGDNYGEVVQALGSGMSSSLTQTDAGDQAGNRSFNSAIISQYGEANVAQVEQNAVGAVATLWQRVGSSGNSMTLGQGSGGTAGASTTSVTGFAPGATGANAQALNANLIQNGANNRTIVYQDGVSLEADVRQYGTGTSASPNRVFVSQTGVDNGAVALQESGVGLSGAGDPSSGNPGDEFYFAGGARSAEIAILQTSSGNQATINQYGPGQLARIEQSGGGSNTASIVQENGATNATAVIRQTGTNNSYYIVQTMPGQYIVVTQTGTGNSAINANIIQRGPTGGSAGFTPPPGS
jgi:trimeric autotransporter adhesin